MKRQVTWCVVLVLSLTASVVSAQLRPATTASGVTAAPQTPATPDKSGTPDFLAPAYLDQVINPDDYHVGPGDIILINIWASRPEQFRIEISPEATFIIPAVGELPVEGLTLTQLKESAIARLRRYYEQTPISVTLAAVRRFRVTVTGAVKKPGLHIVSANTRASEVLDMAGLEDDAARRQVRLERRDTTMLVDLAAFERLGIRDANPYLAEGDVLIAPPLDNRWGNVRIEGAVNLPGTFGFSPGDLVGDLIDLAFGLRADADTLRLELWRFPVGQNEAARFEWPAGTTYSQWRKFALQPDDRLFIRTVEGFRVKRIVRVTGEVVRPGYYPFAGESIHLRDVIDSAGGFTNEADLDHAFIIRYQQPSWVEENRQRVALIPSELRSDAESDLLQADALTVPGRVAADFALLFGQGDESHNVPLYDGDEIIVPRITESVNIIGRVVQPGLVPVEPGADLNYYIERAGGYSWRADRGGTFLVKGGTGSAVKKKQIREISAGDTIVIPTRRGRRWWAAFRETLTVTTSLATLYLVIDQVTQ